MMLRRALRAIACSMALLGAATGCQAPIQNTTPVTSANVNFERRLSELESITRELTVRNNRLEELLASQKEEQRRLQAAIGTLRHELQQEVERRLAAERRESILKERFLSARLESIELQTKLYELQMEDNETAKAEKGK